MSGFVTPFEENEGVTRTNFNTRIAEINGVTVADIGGSNKNLLINWDFRNPVNQRGQAAYTTVGYTVDGWKTAGGKTTVAVGDGVTITVTNQTINTSWIFAQDIEGYQVYAGKNLAVSLNASVTSGAINVRFYDGKKAYISNNLQAGESGIITATGQVSADATQLSVIILNQTESTVFTPISAKLELGTVSTLQNDPPANRAEQENLCARFDAGGNLITGPLQCNRNLLDNADWRVKDAIVNQRGQDSYTGMGYFVDRWRDSSSVTAKTFTDTGIRFTAQSAITATTWISYQLLEHPEKYIGQTLTFSVETGELVGSAEIAIRSDVGSAVADLLENGIVSVTYTIPENITSLLVTVYVRSVEAGNRIDIKRSKLELGPVSTLANDPPQNYGEELVRCQRYYYEANPEGNANANLGNGCSTSGTTCAIWVTLPTKMRLNQPTIAYKGSWNLKTSSTDLHTVTNMTVMSSNNSANRCIAYCTSSGLSTGKVYYLAAAEDTTARLSFSADL